MIQDDSLQDIILNRIDSQDTQIKHLTHLTQMLREG